MAFGARVGRDSGSVASARARAGAFLFGGTADRGDDIIEPRINERIRVPEVRLVGPEGEQVGIVRIEDALRLAQEADLDLVEVAPNNRPPVAKLMDYGKFKYEAAVKAREARRHQANMVVKEIRFRLKIDDHDYETKKGHVERFLKAGDKAKVTIMFRGREQSRPDAGRRLLQRLADDIGDLGVVEHAPVLDGRNMSLTLAPTKKKSEVRDEARREQEARRAQEAAERVKHKQQQKATPEAAPKTASKPAAKSAPKTAATAAPKTAAKPATKAAPKTTPKPATKSAPKTTTKSAPKAASTAASKAASTAASKADTKKTSESGD